jgi:hypothetical protein
MFGKSQPNNKPKLAGLDELDIVSSQTDIPVPYFAGFRKLDVSWVMNAVISHTTNADSGGGKGKSAKGGAGSRNFFGHCAGKICQGQLDFISGLIVNNELVWPDAAIWDSKIFKAKRIVIYTDGNAYKTSVDTDQDPPTFPWTLLALQWVAGSYAKNDEVVNAGFLFQSTHAANVAVPPGTATSSADWTYLSTPDLWATISSNHFWDAGSIVAWEGKVYETTTDTNAKPPSAPWVPFRVLRTASPNPLQITVAKNTRFGQNAGPGDYFLYWGTPDQVLDTVGEAILAGLGHPPYRNCPLLVLKGVLFGTQTITPPSAQILGGRTPVQTLIAGASADLDTDWQANPWTILAEQLSHSIYALGLPATWFDAVSWQAEADHCAANPALFYISPLYTSLKKVSELAADLLGYPDAFIFWSTIATLTAGHWPHGEAAPAFDATNTINRNNITKEFSTDSQGWGGTANSVTVSVQDLQAGFKSRPAIANNLFNLQVTRRLLTQTIDRPHITRFEQGLAWATEFAKIAGDQSSNGTIELQAEKAAAVKAGSLFLLTDDELQTSEVQRCTRRVISAPPTGTVKLSHETERGVAPQPFSPTTPNLTQAAGPSPALILDYAVAQLPTPLAGEPNLIAVLAGRQNGFTSSLDIWFRQADGAAFQKIGTNGAFAVHGTFAIAANSELTVGSPATDNTTLVHLGAVTQGTSYDLGEKAFWQYTVFYSVNSSGIPFTVAAEGTDFTIDPLTGTLTIVVGGNIPTGYYVNVRYWNTVAINYDPNTPGADIDAISAALTQDEINDGDLLLFAFRGDNPALFEIMSVRSIQALGVDPVTGLPVLFVKVWRAQFGTSIGADGSYNFGTTDGDQLFIVQRSQINALSHQAIPGLASSAATATFILSPASAWVSAAIDDIYDSANNPSGLSTEINYTFANIYTPTVTWIQQLKAASGTAPTNGTAIAAFPGAFLTTDSFYFSFQINSQQNNIVGASLTGTLGEQQQTLWATNFAPSGQQNVSVTFQLATAGLWNVFVNVFCADGNQVSYPLTLVGGSTPAQMQVNTPATSFAQTPIIFSYKPIGAYITALKFGVMTTGLTVKYQLRTRGTGFNPASWVVIAESPAGSGKYGPLPFFKSGAKTLWAFSQGAGLTDSAPVSWNL